MLVQVPIKLSSSLPYRVMHTSGARCPQKVQGNDVYLEEVRAICLTYLMNLINLMDLKKNKIDEIIDCPMLTWKGASNTAQHAAFLFKAHCL